MAIERGDSPATLLHDVPTPFSSNGATWSPRDHDRRFRGPVRLREALAASLNVPAARLLATIGVERFQAVLRDLGFDELDAPSNEYGIGLVLGDGPVRLASLVEAYSALARLGTHVPLTLVQGRDQGLGQGQVLAQRRKDAKEPQEGIEGSGQGLERGQGQRQAR